MRAHSPRFSWLVSRSAVLILALLVACLAGVARGQVITEFRTFGSSLDAIAAGPDGNLWFTDLGDEKIGRITTSGVATPFFLPTANAQPGGIAAGPDGNLWFTESGANKIGRITTAGIITEFPIPTAGSCPCSGIVAGPDGNLWFTVWNHNLICRITTAGVVTEFPAPEPPGSGGRFPVPRSIAAGPDGNLWFTEEVGNKIGRITTAGVVTEFPVPNFDSHPWGIAAGPDGNLWFTENNWNVIGRITTDGVITEFSISTGKDQFTGIAAGPDGNLWFTEWYGNRIGRITTDFVFTEFPVPGLGGPEGIAAGPDGNLWFTESYLAGIGRITPTSPEPCIADSTALCLNSDRFKVEVTWSVPSQGRSGIGTAVSLTGDTGYFWFFNDANVELVIKALDARTVNQHYWVFYGALSNVQYTITVTDTQTGAVKTYTNPSGQLASVADTSAFDSSGTSLATPAASAQEIEARSGEELYGLYAAPTRVAVVPKIAAPGCTPGGPTLCLNQSRFQLTVDWEVPSQGTSGHGTAISITGDTGYFWFFNDANVELVIKVLDGRSINGHYWVFYGALSNVQYTITVTDTQTQLVKTYTNPSGTLASVADTKAF